MLRPHLLVPGALLCLGLFVVQGCSNTASPDVPPGTAGTAGTVTLGPAVAVTSSNPLTSQVDLPQDGTVFLDSQVEDYIAVNPVQPTNILCGWQQDRWGSGAARALVAGASKDGGATWKAVPLPGTTAAAGNPTYLRGADPWVAFAPNGVAYFATLLGNFQTRTSAVAISRSFDGGLTWGAPRILSDGNNDKEAVTVDRFSSERVYVVWHKRADDAQENNENGNLFLARSTDGGETYEAERQLTDFPPDQGAIATQILSLNSGRLLNLFAHQAFGGKRLARLGEMHSDDGGVTWTGANVTTLSLFARSTLTPDEKGVRDPGDGTNVRDPGFFPNPAEDPRNGVLYNVWQDTRFSAPPGVSPVDADPGVLIDEVALSFSEDQGITWSEPIKVNKTPADLPLLHRQAFLPSVAVASDGTVVVTYYDFRNYTAGSPILATDYWASYHRPGSGPITDPSTWQEVRLTDESFDTRRAPRSGGEGEDGGAASGYFLGDYVGLTRVPGGVISCHSQALGTFPASVVVRKILFSGL